MGVFVCWKMEKGAMRLDGWDVCFVRVTFGLPCCVHAFPKLRLFAREVIGVEH